tara:strand:- start:679 stop:1389 length:711 start_codon:yes stop_codon:yes gene_type:complete
MNYKKKFENYLFCKLQPKMYRIPKENQSKPTTWIKNLDLRCGKEEEIKELKKMVIISQFGSTHVPYTTENVDKPAIKRFKKWLKPITELPPQKLNVIPIGGICMCHTNADTAVNMLNHLNSIGACEFTWRLAIGYNLMACKCGRDLHGEVHSVIHCIEKNEYYDITEDMFGETEKWFVECPSLTENYFKVAEDNGCRIYDMIANNTTGCKKCNISRLEPENTYANNNLDAIKKVFE